MYILHINTPASTAMAELDSMSLKIAVMSLVFLGAVLLALFGVVVILMVVLFVSLALRKRTSKRGVGSPETSSMNCQAGPRHAKTKPVLTGQQSRAWRSDETSRRSDRRLMTSDATTYALVLHD